MDGNDDGQKGNSQGKPGIVMDAKEAMERVMDGMAMGISVLAAAKGCKETRNILNSVMDGLEEVEKHLDGESN